jgi:hypothetical protein
MVDAEISAPSWEDAMIARYALPFSPRSIVERLSFLPAEQPGGPTGGVRLNRLQRMFAALGDRLAVSHLARRHDIILDDGSERFRSFCRDCGEDTPHEGFDEFGAGWYAQICRCRHCGRQGMRVWPFCWW